MDQQAIESLRYPPAPWRLCGNALILACLIDVRRARAWVPAPLRLVPIWPGKTLGGVLLANYGEGSTLRYHELIVFPGLVRCGLRTGFWISHIYVDDLRSVRAGREMWGVPKELAEFSWEPGSQLPARVSQQGTDLIETAFTQSRLRVPTPLLVASMGAAGAGPRWFMGRGKARLSWARAKVSVPAGSPFYSLGLDEPFMAFDLEAVDLWMGNIRPAC